MTELYAIFLFFITSLATWRITRILHQEEGFLDIAVKIRSYVGLRNFSELTIEEQVEYLEKIKLDTMSPPPLYAHDGNHWARLMSCHGCLSVTIGFLISIYMWLIGTIAFSLVPLYIFALSTLSIKVELIMNGR